MTGIYPIPTGRSSDALLTQRLMFQLQAEQKRLMQVEQQLSTGKRYQLASEDASSANRALSLQLILDGKQQQTTNLSTGQSFLNATDTALGGVADLLSQARAMAVQAADSTTSDLERQSLAQEIQATVDRLLDVGNQQFRGRYLFAGSKSTVQPFASTGKYVAFAGNDTALRTYANQNLLFDTNVPGQELFGAVSAEVQGVDLNPVLTSQTRLADLRNGQGIAKGDFLISDGSVSSTVSIANAETLGDVARLIEANPPLGRTVTVTVEAQGLRIEIDAAGGGDFTIRDEPGGRTAAQLGILQTSGHGVAPIVGSDLDPILRATTRLDDILSGSWDQDSGLQITNGDQAHVIDISAAETVDDLLNILNGAGANVLAEINERRDGINVRSRLSGADLSIGENGGSTATDLGLRSFAGTTQLAVLNYRQGVDTNAPAEAAVTFDVPPRNNTALRFVAKTTGTQWQGIDIEFRNTRVGGGASATFDGSSLIIDIEDTVTTANDVIAAVMAEGTFRAELDSSIDRGNTGLGTLVAADASPATTAGGTAFTIQRGDGIVLHIDLSSAQTLADVVRLINTHPDNLDPATAVTAGLRAFGNGIELVDSNTTGAFALQVRRSPFCTAAWDLGLVPQGADVSLPPDAPAVAAVAAVTFDVPHSINTAFRYVAASGGTQWNGVDIEFRNTLAGDVAVATFDDVSIPPRLIIDMADGATTTNTVIAAVLAEGTFQAELDPSSDGTGTIAAAAASPATTAGGTSQTVVGSDRNPIETQGLFNSLLRLHDAVADYDITKFQRIVEMLDEDFDRLNFGRADVGARNQSLDAITMQNEDEQVELRTLLSDEVDIDFAQAASDFASRQAIYEATLRSIANLFQMSLLDFM
ncbi:MAG: flagellar hook-associated protein FlgL [Pirellulaceae bacterium]